MFEIIENWDRALFLFINGIHSPFFDKLMFAISGELTWLPLYLILLYFLFKKYGLKAMWLPVLFVLLTVVSTDQLSVKLFKNVIQRYRPCHNLDIQSMVHLVNDYCGGQFGFVSSHAANTFGVATILSLTLKNKTWTGVLIFWAFINIYSRIYLGVHYPSDVLFGAILGAAIGAVYYKLNKRFEKIWLN